MNSLQLSRISRVLVSAFEAKEINLTDRKINVNPVVSKLASWYEIFRNAIDYREEEVILRASIERTLKRRLLLGGKGITVAEPLLRELVWARYFPNDSVSETHIEAVAKKIDMYLALRSEILSIGKLNEKDVSEWVFDLMSSDIEQLLNPIKAKELISNFMFHVLKDQVRISDDSEQTRDAQVFIAVRRSFAKDDLAFLRFHLFTQYFGKVTSEKVKTIAESFQKGYSEIQNQLNHPRKDNIFRYVRSKTAAFFILEDIIRNNMGRLSEVFATDEVLDQEIKEACSKRYKGIASKVRKGIIRSVFFLLIAKALFAFAVEGTFEKIVYGEILWNSIALNTFIPPLLMVVAGVFIRTPGQENTKLITSYIKSVLYDEHPKIGSELSAQRNPERTKPVLNAIFSFLWLAAFFITFGGIIYILNRFNFNPISIGIFLFFFAIVSFLTYRIGVVSRSYTVGSKQGLLTPIVDFFFMPIIRTGRHLTEGITQVNIIVLAFDFIIDAPFKGLFAFFEQWFFFLHTKREGLD